MLEKTPVEIKDNRELKPYFGRMDSALTDCLNDGFEPLFIPEIVDERINSDRDSLIWHRPFYGVSIKVSGKSKGGNRVTAYCHKPHFFCSPENIGWKIQRGIVNGAGIMPKDEFYRILDMEDNEKVFVMDYDLSEQHHPPTEISIEKALKDPQTIPFLGGRGRAEEYLETYARIYKNRVRIIYEKDFSIQYLALARFLYLGYGSYPTIDSDNDFDNPCWIVGRRKIQESGEKEIAKSEDDGEKEDKIQETGEKEDSPVNIQEDEKKPVDEIKPADIIHAEKFSFRKMLKNLRSKLVGR